MNFKLQQYCEQRSSEFNLISEERQLLLKTLSAFISGRKTKTDLLFVCTHNSRRSTFGQVWAKTAANFYQKQLVDTFSGGTEVTAFHPNAIKALKNAGFDVHSDIQKKTPYIVYLSMTTRPTLVVIPRLSMTKRILQRILLQS